MSKQEIELASEGLTAKQERFCQTYIECRNATTSYRIAYNVKEMAEWVYADATRLLRNPRVAARIAELRGIHDLQVIITAREVVQDWVDMASVDANELVQLRTINCRHCWGFEHRYQWHSEREFIEATEEAQSRAEAGVKGVRMPDPLGGFEFNVRKPPNLDCPKCSGRGECIVRFTDTDQLSARARKLYKGVKLTANGSLELLLHDASAARVELAKALQIYDKGARVNPAAPAQPIAQDVSEDEAARAYLEMVSPSRR